MQESAIAWDGLVGIQLFLGILTIGVLLIAALSCARKWVHESRPTIRARWLGGALLCAVFALINIGTIALGLNTATTPLSLVQEAVGLMATFLLLAGIRLANIALSESTLLRARIREQKDALDAYQASLEKLVSTRTAALRTEIGQRRETERKLRDANMQHERDVALAREFQLALMTPLPRFGYGRMVVHFAPAAEVSGDIYVSQADEEECRLVIADAMGHGLAAGLLTQLVQATVQRRSLSTTGPQLLAELNDTILTGQQIAFVTATCLRLNQAGLLRITSAGAPSVLLWRQIDAKIEVIDGAGFAVGMFEAASDSFEERELQLQPGDRVFALTDGMTEARNQDGEMYGIERAIQVLEDTGPQILDLAFPTLLASVHDHCGDVGFSDDVTVVALQYGEAT